MNVEKAEFEFDLSGYAVVPQFLAPGEVAQMTRAVKTAGLAKDGPKFAFVESDEVFFDLIFRPSVLQLCARWIGPHFRFDHAWGVHHPPKKQKTTMENLHAGPHQNQGFFHYSWLDNKP